MRPVLRHHPSGVEMGAWFDGEHDGGVGAHAARCPRCRRAAEALAELRSALRPARGRASEPVGPGVAGG